MSAVTCEDMTKTCPGLPRSCSLTQEEHESQLDGNKNLGNAGRMVEVSAELGMQKKEKNPGIDTVQDINSNNTDNQQDTCRDPEYEDISEDEDKSKLLSSELYEDVSDDENQCIQQSAELSEPITVNSRTGLDELQIPATETRCCRSPLLQTEGDGHETNISSSVLKDKQELDYQHDDYDEEEDIWDLMPLTIANLQFEQTDDGECGSKTSSSFTNPRLGTAPNPVPASAFSQMEVFDTPAQQKQAVKSGQVSSVVPSNSSNHQRTSNIPGSREELSSEDEETEDSLDYSSGSESNYLTVSNQFRNSSSSLITDVSLDSEERSQGDQTKNYQKSFNQDDIVYIDSDDDECVKTKSTTNSPNCENIGTKSQCKNDALPPALDPATAQLQEGRTETTNLCQGTTNRPTHSDDDVIIILSDSDDGSVEVDVEDLEQSSAEWSEPRPESSWEKPGTSKLIPPGQTSYHELSRERKDVRRKRTPSSETEEENVDENLNNAVNDRSNKQKKVKLSEKRGSLGPVIPRLLVQPSPLSGQQLQLVHESVGQSGETDLSSSSSTEGSHSESFRNKSPHSIREETGKFTSKFKRSKKVHNTPGSKVDPSFEPKKRASSLKGHPAYSRHSPSCPPVPLRSSSSFSATSEQSNHARRKVFSDWQKNHVPLRRERKARKANCHRQSL